MFIYLFDLWRCQINLEPSILCLPSPDDTAPPVEMQDEYGHMDASGRTFQYAGDFPLELNGAFLRRPQVRYNTWGELNAAGDNCVVVCHALTGNASLDTWWGGLLGPGRAFDTQRYFVVCANVLGGCRGSTGPGTVDQATGRPYGADFPPVNVADMVAVRSFTWVSW